jgi:hypothetical protein
MAALNKRVGLSRFMARLQVWLKSVVCAAGAAPDLLCQAGRQTTIEQSETEVPSSLTVHEQQYNTTQSTTITAHYSRCDAVHRSSSARDSTACTAATGTRVSRRARSMRSAITSAVGSNRAEPKPIDQRVRNT